MTSPATAAQAIEAVEAATKVRYIDSLGNPRRISKPGALAAIKRYRDTASFGLLVEDGRVDFRIDADGSA